MGDDKEFKNMSFLTFYFILTYAVLLLSIV